MSAKRHVPDQGYCQGLRGPSLCGRVASYGTGDHSQIESLAVTGGSHWCTRCRLILLARRALAAIEIGTFENAKARKAARR